MIGISVLLPTRGRPASVDVSTRSLIDRATHGRRLEVLVAVDPDDPDRAATRAVVGALPVDTTLWTAPRRYGYGHMQEYYNRLARRARGEWLMLWNDDATMLSDGWDDAIDALPPEIIVADLWAPPHSPSMCTFPAVRRWAVDAIGAFSPHTNHADTYWQDIGRALEAIAPVRGAHVRHDRSDITGGHDDRTRREALGGYKPHEYYGPPVQGFIRADVKILRAARDDRTRMIETRRADG